MNGKDLRVEKLFSKGKNAVIVAIDHGMFDGPIPGMINMKKMADKIDPCIDGVLLSPGMLKQIRPVFNYKGAPMPIVRLNWSSVYSKAKSCWVMNSLQTVAVYGIKKP